MRYAVTYCVLDDKAGSNPLWHSCLLLSQWQEKSKIEVVAQWGFYGLPEAPTENCLSHWKTRLGLNFSFQGNHGMLRQEAIRFLDLGVGLHGVTYELTHKQFLLLQEKCHMIIANQEKAIAEAAAQLKLIKKNPAQTKIYSYEDAARQIFALEKKHAKQNGQSPRLKSFELQCKLSLFGLTFNNSHTCKSQALELLSYVLTPQQLSRLTENGKHKALPKYSGPMETIFLHSDGPLRSHPKRNGQTVFYRQWQDPGVKLYWSLPPAELITSNNEAAFFLPVEYVSEIKTLISKLQRIEWLFINAELPSQHKYYTQQLINKIRQSYEDFARIHYNKTQPDNTGLTKTLFSLFSIPQSQEEYLLQQKIAQAKILLNSLYFALIDNWKIPYSDYEAVAAYLPIKDKQKLCFLLGKKLLPYQQSSFCPANITS